MNNNVIDENTKLKTRLFKCETELAKKEKMIEDILSSYQHSPERNQSKATRKLYNALKIDTHLTNNLKKQIKDQRVIIQ